MLKLFVCAIILLCFQIIVDTAALTAESAEALISAARELLKKQVNAAQAAHTAKWKEHLCTNRKTTSAKAFFRYPRNDSKEPISSFVDPITGVRTCEPRQINLLFQKHWHDVYSSDNPPDFEVLFAE